MRFAIRAKSIVTLAGEQPARTPEALDAPLRVMDDGVVTIDGWRIESVEPYARYHKRPGAHAVPLLDIGEQSLAPGLINSHCHLELSHLAGKSHGGNGFIPWLQSIVKLVSRPPDPAVLHEHLEKAVLQLTQSCTAHVGDVGSRTPASVATALAHSGTVFFPDLRTPCPAARISGQDLPRPAVSATHFLEVLGFGEPLQNRKAGSPFPPSELAAGGYAPEAAAGMSPASFKDCAISGHSLYSVSPAALQAAHSWCLSQKKTFSLHLAEFSEETDLLLHGKGALFDYIKNVLLPENWQAPKLRPVAYARSLDLLGPETLAIHCTQCQPEDIALLAATRTSCCLCPRSNAYIGVGEAPAGRLARAGVLLCLGTDGLSSNDDLDIRKEMRAAEKLWGFSSQALVRMVTINAAHALGVSGSLGSLEPGKRAVFSILEDIFDKKQKNITAVTL